MSFLTKCILAAAFTLVLSHGLAPAAPSSITYSNPLPFSYESQGKTFKELRDPCIIRDGDTYYVIFTMWPFRNYTDIRPNEPDLGSAPGIRMYSTRDFKTWKDEGFMVKSSDLPADCPYKHQFWAPEIHYDNGKFYIIFTASNWEAARYHLQVGYFAFVGVADKVTGPYQHITKIPNGPCDTTLFTDPAGRFYLAMPRTDIYVQQVDLSHLDQDIVKRVGPEVLAVKASSADIHQPVSPIYLEGPWVERIGSRYNLFYAENYGKNGGYWTGVAYADRPLGPYRKDPRAKVFFGGHLAIFDGPDGRKWFSYRGERDDRVRGGLCIDPMDFDAAGVVHTADTIQTPVTVPIKH